MWLPIRQPRTVSTPKRVAEREIAVAHEGVNYPVRVRTSARASRYTLKIMTATGEAVLTMPPRGSWSTALDFAHRHGGWLAQRYRRMPARTLFAPGAEVPIRGVPHRIVHRPEARGGAWLEPAAAGGPVLVVTGAPDFLDRRVHDFLKKEARRAIEASVARHAARLGVTISRITVRDTVSRWGSCSATGALSFSWRLILAPPFVLDYLCAHEVAHRREMNHSARYWRVVAFLDPAYGQAEAWLKRHGAALHRIG
jgi:hypothetical protein